MLIKLVLDSTLHQPSIPRIRQMPTIIAGENQEFQGCARILEKLKNNQQPTLLLKHNSKIRPRY